MICDLFCDNLKSCLILNLVLFCFTKNLPCLFFGYKKTNGKVEVMGCVAQPRHLVGPNQPNGSHLLWQLCAIYSFFLSRLPSLVRSFIQLKGSRVNKKKRANTITLHFQLCLLLFLRLIQLGGKNVISPL